MNRFNQCPRCGDMAFEHLKTHGHCVGCLYFENYHFDSETAYHQSRRIELGLQSKEKEKQPKEFRKRAA